MSKVTGIKSVDFKITAYGHGVVNWNGPTELTGNDGKTVKNHTMPKLRGYSNLTGKVKEGNGYKYRKDAQDLNFAETPMYISQNCVRHHLFSDQSYDLHFANADNLISVIASLTGLVRGYVVPNIQCKRASPLLMEDFVDELGNGNFEQFGQAGVRDSSSFFSKTTFGDTKYTSHGSISISQLQFICLDKKFDKAAANLVDEGQGEVIAEAIESYISSISKDLNLKPKATFHGNYVRSGTIFDDGECGILLNDDAIQIVVDEMIENISELSIRQAKAYMYVDELLVDYNDSNKMMRIKRDPSSISEVPQDSYAVFYDAREAA